MAWHQPPQTNIAILMPLSRVVLWTKMPLQCSKWDKHDKICRSVYFLILHIKFPQLPVDPPLHCESMNIFVYSKVCYWHHAKFAIGRRITIWALEQNGSRCDSRCSILSFGIITKIWAPSQYPKRRLFVRSRKVSKPRDWYFKLSYRFEIWQAHRHHCCRSACQISERSDNSKYKSCGFETLRHLTERRLFGYRDGAQLPLYQ